MYRKKVLAGLMIVVISCCATCGHRSVTCPTDTENPIEVANVETALEPQAADERPTPPYTYTQDESSVYNYGGNYINSTPVLWGYIKWVGGNNRDELRYDGEFVYQGKSRYNMRTLEVEAMAWSIHRLPEDGVVYSRNRIAGKRGLWAVDAADGKVKWFFEGIVKDAIFLSGGKVAIVVGKLNSAEGRLVCLDKATGKELWRKDPLSEHGGVFACGENVIEMSFAKGPHLRAVEPEEGRTLWETDTRGALVRGHIFSDGSRIFTHFNTVEGERGTASFKATPWGVAYDGRTGKEIWRVKYALPAAIDGEGRIVAVEDLRPEDTIRIVFLDPATGKITAAVPTGPASWLMGVVGDWSLNTRLNREASRAMRRIIMVLETVNVKTGETRLLLDGGAKDAEYNPHGVAITVDGYVILVSDARSGVTECAFMEDMRFHPDAAKMIFDIRPEMFDEKMKARIASLIEKLGDASLLHEDCEKEIQSLMDLPCEQLEAASKEDAPAKSRLPASELLKKAVQWKNLRKYLDELGCRKDPIYFTALIRHTADLAIQEKAIDRLKKITAQDFGLKPSAEWIKDQKEASDKYDDWWFKNRDKLAWSDKEDRYIPRQP